MADDTLYLICIVIQTAICAWAVRAAYSNGACDGYRYARDPEHPGMQKAGEHIRKHLKYFYSDLELLEPVPRPRVSYGSFQRRVGPWLLGTFGIAIARDPIERNHRFLEEALELVQSLGCTRSEAKQLVDYVFDRPIGEPHQEAGGVMVTLAALCLANHLDMHVAGDTELERIWTKVDEIRAKQATKPKHSPLPGRAQ